MTRREHKEELTNEFQDDGGRVLSQTQNTISASVPSVLSVDLDTYDRYGDRTFSALDVNHNGVINFGGPDRVTGYTTAYIVKNNALWQEAAQTVYPDFDSDRTVTTAMSRRKLTNLGAYISVSENSGVCPLKIPYAIALSSFRGLDWHRSESYTCLPHEETG